MGKAPAARYGRKRRNAKSPVITFFAAALAIVAAAGALIYYVASRPVLEESVIIEAGDPVPPPSAFMLNKKKTAEYTGTIPSDTNAAGVHPIEIVTNGKTYYSKLIVRDTVPPKAQGTDIVNAWVGAQLNEADFISYSSDVTKLTFSFENKPDVTSPGLKSVAVLVTDTGGNVTHVDSALRVYEPVDRLGVSLGTDKNTIKASDFAVDPLESDSGLFTLETDISAIDFSVPGKHDIAVRLGGSTTQCVLDLLDVTPPSAKPVHVKKWLSDTVTPEEFVGNIVDETPVTVSFAGKAPDMELAGDQQVALTLTDAYGNTTSVTAVLTLRKDVEPPVIMGEINKEIFVGDTISYRAGVTASDNRDGELTLKIDSSAVDTGKEGVYSVIYSADDASGNKASVKGTVTVYSVSREQVYEMADKALAGIVNDTMSQRAKAQAIYNWVRKKVSYSNSTVKDDPVYAAYRGFKSGTGDCYVFYALSELLLTRAGIDNQPISCVPTAKSPHYWSLVNLGEGWYHFDTTPHPLDFNGFMVTESYLQEYTKRRGKNLFEYDKSLYPEVVK